ncbi:hypothetical protein C8R44DRAFT_867499 [Mycena epipterygia]|nr:hypothetical protein C8R44DRAFT_867499 [Mycena epipterygia]
MLDRSPHFEAAKSSTVCYKPHCQSSLRLGSGAPSCKIYHLSRENVIDMSGSAWTTDELFLFMIPVPDILAPVKFGQKVCWLGPMYGLECRFSINDLVHPVELCTVYLLLMAAGDSHRTALYVDIHHCSFSYFDSLRLGAPVPAGLLFYI